MNWDFPMMQRATSTMQAPVDGIVASQAPQGAVARRWLALLDQVPRAQRPRLARGRTFARGGRVRELWIAPGQAQAEVIGTEVRRTTLRVRSYSAREWERIVALLLEDLSNIASLLEGELPRSLVEGLERQGIQLVPELDKVDGDCTCADYAFPCAHAAAVHHVLADALDGDPFLLLTLRGKSRDQLLGTLRRAWGDDLPLSVVATAELDEEPPDGDWFASPEALGELAFSLREPDAEAAGLHALGPPPGGEDLLQILAPMYQAGTRAALDMAQTQVPLLTEHVRRRKRRAPRIEVASEPPLEDQDMSRSTRKKTPSDRRTDNSAGTPLTRPPDLTEAVVNLLAELESATPKDMADHLNVDLAEVRSELLELEKLGLVYRTGRTRGTRWWLG